MFVGFVLRHADIITISLFNTCITTDSDFFSFLLIELERCYDTLQEHKRGRAQNEVAAAAAAGTNLENAKKILVTLCLPARPERPPPRLTKVGRHAPRVNQPVDEVTRNW